MSMLLIEVDTMTLLCQANVTTTLTTVSGSSRAFLVNRVEEFSNITITVTARNNGGEGRAAVLIQTSPAGSTLLLWWFVVVMT